MTIEIAIEIEQREWFAYMAAQQTAQEWTQRRHAADFRRLPLAAQSVIRSNVIESRVAAQVASARWQVALEIKSRILAASGAVAGEGRCDYCPERIATGVLVGPTDAGEPCEVCRAHAVLSRDLPDYLR